MQSKNQQTYKEMKIKESGALYKLTKLSRKYSNHLEFGKDLATLLESRGIVKNERGYWNYPIEDFIEDDMSDIVKILFDMGLDIVRYENIKELTSLVLMGDGDCPVCGADMEVVDGNYEHVAGDGYNSEKEYEPIWEEKECPNCGHMERV